MEAELLPCDSERVIGMKHIVLYILFFATFISCGHLQEAKQVIREADSLRIQGCLYQDSTCISRAIAVLSPLKYIHPTDYAKANYYYGRLLRERNLQLDAMQCFLKALHSNTQDNDLRGRIYTNIAIMCRLEGNHLLSYDMFELSAQSFLKNQDSIAYYYAVNSMAFELAELGRKEESTHLLSIIERECTDRDVIIKVLETKAESYFMVQQYDSAIYYANLLEQYGYHEPTGSLIKAQSFYHLNQGDSAIYYAKEVSLQSSSLFDLNNAYYILANEDTIASIEELQSIHANRSDIQKQIEIRRSKLSHAIELLQQDLSNKSNYFWLVRSVLFILFIVTISTYSYIKIKRKHKDLKECIEQEEVKQQLLREEQLEKIESICEAIRSSHNIAKELNWSNYNLMCETINAQFNFFTNKLKATNKLNETEVRLCVLVLINLPFSKIAQILPYAPNSIGKLKDTTAKHLGTTGKELRKFLLNLSIYSH